MALSRGSKIFIVIGVVVVLLVGGGLYYVSWLLGGEPGSGEPVAVQVSSGATAATVGDLLQEEGVVRSALAFRLVARSRDLDDSLQAGTYDLETGMSVDEAIDALLGGPLARDTFRFTVQEGLTVEQTLARLAEQSPYSVEEYRAVLDEGELSLPDWVPALDEFGPDVREPYEGLLFPETYEMFAEATPQDVLQRMIDQLGRVVDTIPEEQVEAKADVGYELYDGLIAASLIERETQVDEERPVVAGVIANRLEDGMPLQIDATCLYAIGEHRERVLQADCEVESPYNTYLVKGLPPTPISGVGAASIRAFFAPEETDFLYYVLSADCSGRHEFSRTLDEHNQKVAEFRQSDCAP